MPLAYVDAGWFYYSKHLLRVEWRKRKNGCLECDRSKVRRNIGKRSECSKRVTLLRLFDISNDKQPPYYLSPHRRPCSWSPSSSRKLRRNRFLKDHSDTSLAQEFISKRILIRVPASNLHPSAIQYSDGKLGISFHYLCSFRTVLKSREIAREKILKSTATGIFMNSE